IDEAVGGGGELVEIADQLPVAGAGRDARQMNSRAAVQLVQAFAVCGRQPPDRLAAACDQRRQFIPLLLVTTDETAHTHSLRGGSNRCAAVAGIISWIAAG